MRAGGTDPSRVRSVVLLVVAVVVVPALCWTVGLVPAQALLVAAAGAVVAATLRFLPAVQDPPWPDPPEADRDRGARRDVSRLSWSTTGDHAVGTFGLRRLQAVGRRRLARSGLDPAEDDDRDAIVALLGEAAARVLADDRSEPVGGRDFAATLTALEALDPTTAPPRDGRPTRGAA